MTPPARLENAVAYRVIGAPVKRKEDFRLLTGRGKYAADVRLPGLLHAAMLRSPHPHARIVAVRADAARAVPGVFAVITADDLGIVPRIPVRLGQRAGVGPTACLQPPLATGVVRYVGEPIAFVVAASRYLAEDALELVEIDWELLPVVADARRAGDPGVPILHPAAGGNIIERLVTRAGDPAGALASAERRIAERFAVQRHTGVPMETRGLTAAHDPGTRVLTLWGVAKVPHFNRRVLADLLGLPEHLIHFIELEVGGGFGVRGEFYPEDYLVPWTAMRLGRPVQWIEDRREHLMATNHSRQQYHEVEIGVRRDGTIVGLRDRFMADLGAYIRTHGVVVPELTIALLPGPYRIKHYECEGLCVLTNKTPTGTYRGPGRYEGTFVRERLIDRVAAELGLDPADVRRRNFIEASEMPYEVGGVSLGQRTVYDCGDYHSAFEQALAVGGLHGDARRAGAGAGAGPLSRDRPRLRAREGGARPLGVRARGGRRLGERGGLLRRRGGRAGDRDDPGPGRRRGAGHGSRRRHRRPRRQRARAVRHRRLREPRRRRRAAGRAGSGAKGAGQDLPGGGVAPRGSRRRSRPRPRQGLRARAARARRDLATAGPRRRARSPGHGARALRRALLRGAEDDLSLRDARRRCGGRSGDRQGDDPQVRRDLRRRPRDQPDDRRRPDRRGARPGDWGARSSRSWSTTSRASR